MNFINNFAEVNQELAQELREAFADGENVEDILFEVVINEHPVSPERICQLIDEAQGLAPGT